MELDVRCCCDPGTVLGRIDLGLGVNAGLRTRALEDGGIAFDSHGREEAEIEAIPGFVAAKKGDRKTWLKTWRNK